MSKRGVPPLLKKILDPPLLNAWNSNDINNGCLKTEIVRWSSELGTPKRVSHIIHMYDITFGFPSKLRSFFYLLQLCSINQYKFYTPIISMSLHVNTVLTMRLKHLQYNTLCYPEDPKFLVRF